MAKAKAAVKESPPLDELLKVPESKPEPGWFGEFPEGETKEVLRRIRVKYQAGEYASTYPHISALFRRVSRDISLPIAEEAFRKWLLRKPS